MLTSADTGSNIRTLFEFSHHVHNFWLCKSVVSTRSIRWYWGAVRLCKKDRTRSVLQKLEPLELTHGRLRMLGLSVRDTRLKLSRVTLDFWLPSLSMNLDPAAKRQKLLDNRFKPMLPMTTSSSSSSKNTRRACPPSSLGSTASKKTQRRRRRQVKPHRRDSCCSKWYQASVAETQVVESKASTRYYFGAL